jgi:hypothetical protein
MKRNRRLLLKTAKRIEEVPESYNQCEWVAESSSSPCGTVACLAGEIVICSERTVKKGIEKLYNTFSVAGKAREAAGLGYGESERLFYSPKDWPNGIGKNFRRKSKTEKAKAAATLLRYLADGGEV